MRSPIIDMRRRSSVMRMAFHLGGGIFGIATVAAALSGLILEDRLVYAEAEADTGGMTVLSGDVRHPPPVCPRRSAGQVQG